jgi:NodT family efflux transporter outer membrane factor (OMF) lipoprotein
MHLKLLDIRKTLCMLPILSGLTGCMVGPDFLKPEAPATDTYTAEPLPPKTQATPELKGGAAQVFKTGVDIPHEWWELFKSPELNALIDRGIENSPDLQTAQATLLQVQEELSALTGELMYPSIGLDLFAGREQLSSLDSLEGSPGETLADFPTQQLSLYNANVEVDYVLDIFGGNRRAIESLRAAVDYQAYQVEATYIALTANIVTTAIAEAALRAEIEATEEIIYHESSLLDLIDRNYQIGSSSRIAVLAQETELAQTRAELPPLQNELAQTRHALSVLVGGYPSDEDIPKFRLDMLHLPEELPLSIPSQLVRQRPDIRAAEALLHQATADIGVATANLLPSFPITASYGVNSDTLDNFFNVNNINWNWQADVLQTVFNGGALWAQRRSAIAAFEAAFAQYNLAVLIGLQNVADTLTALEYDSRTLQDTAMAEEAARELMMITERQYKNGSLNYLDLIYAQTAYQETYIDRINAEAARYADTAALFQALGGGWWNRKDETNGDTDED